MDPFSPENETEFTEELKQKVMDFIESVHPDDERDPYYMIDLIFNVPESEVKKWIQAKSTTILTTTIESISPDSEGTLDNITDSLMMIKKSMKKLERHNQRLIQKWKEKRNGPK